MSVSKGEVEGRDALVERLFGATIHALELFSVYVGVRLGLYESLRGEDMTALELAARAGIHERYAREWLEQQAVAGFLHVADDGTARSDRRYRLPAAHADVVAEPESPAHVAPFSLLLAGIGQALPDLLEAYRTGTGVAYARYGADLRDGQGAINRPAFIHDLGPRWLAQIPAVDQRLRSDPAARVADVACGQGWSTIAVARAYPKVRVDGFDLDEASIADAKRNAAQASSDERVSFEVRDAADASLRGRYDLCLCIEALHDMARPVEALTAMRAMLAPGGSVLIVDERVADDFVAPGGDIERMMYGWSVLHCLPVGMAEQPSAATGTVMRPDTLRRYATDAGFTTVEILPIDNDLFRFYLLRT